MNMSEKEKRIPTNDEIVDALMENLESECTVSVPSESQTSATPTPNPSTDIPVPEIHPNRLVNDEECEEKPPIADDYIDEDSLRENQLKYSIDQLTEHYDKSLELKEEGNALFRSESFLESLDAYTQGLRLCPVAVDKQEARAVLYCNRAAAKIKLARPEAALDDCTKAIELNPSYVRAYLRRAALLEEKDKLDEALEDYKKLLELDASITQARDAVARLPPKIQERNEKLKDEMLGKLKDLGNMILKPFGLSTENFKMQQDANTGGYSINFQQ